MTSGYRRAVRPKHVGHDRLTIRMYRKATLGALCSAHPAEVVPAAAAQARPVRRETRFTPPTLGVLVLVPPRTV